MEQRCVFKFRYGTECDDKASLSETAGTARIESIIHASKVYGDNLHVELRSKLAEIENLKIYYHRNCVSRYTSKSNLKKYENEESAPPVKRLRRSLAVFDFKLHCLYCGEICEIHKDPKHPQRWRPAFLCRSTHADRRDKSYKAYLLERCHSRNDRWATEVQSRIEGAVSDLHAVDARYHRDCMSLFLSNRCLSQDPEGSYEPSGEAFVRVIDILQFNKSRIWNSVELFKEYRDNQGSALTHRSLLEKVQQHFGDDLVVLTSPGYASLIAFHENAAVMMKMVKDDDETDDIEKCVNMLAKHIVKECKAIPTNKSAYQVHIDMNVAAEFASSTLLKLLATLSTKLDETLPALLIASVITDVLTNYPTPLQVALGVLLGDSKSIVGHMYDYRITCSYNELLRFKSSAATAASADLVKQGVSDAGDGLIQVVADNFDADISSPNGKLSTHSLAIIIMQSTGDHDNSMNETIPRLKKSEMSKSIEERQENETEIVTCPKKPPIPVIQAIPLSSDILQHQNVSRRRAAENDFAFFLDVITTDNCAEFNGYNTKMCREQGHSLAPKTKVAYLPLIDKPPADPATMMTAMLKAQQISEDAGQSYTIFTLDQQLYRIALHVLWANETRFQNFYLRLGGMHLLMSYLGCIGTLMADTGIAEILTECCFWGCTEDAQWQEVPAKCESSQDVGGRTSPTPLCEARLPEYG
ncbi:hypothetical protein HOLleu_39220 [Holothuria leucospilota]|uniref:Uncharacterized protein n=1 Tax=Holothuria leucospilota TaxID=206669 RepID=A0A9Q1BBM0_HOLLE|nr:hypothetical protein HOLleu_39220 [Holothuria leucospilota]